MTCTDAQSPRAKLRALEVNQKNWDIDVTAFSPVTEAPATLRSLENAGETKNNMVAFRKGDADVLLDMAKDEEMVGNFTGADALLSIADKIQLIIDR